MVREWLFLECSQCGMRYYRTSKSSKKQAKMEFKKFCPKCRARILHKEKKK